MRIDFEVATFLVQPNTHTLTANGFNGSEDGSGRGTPITVAEVAGTLDANHSTKGQDSWTGKLAAFDCKAAGDNGLSIGDVPGTLRAEHGGGHAAVFGDVGVRRLTPRECERLQGAPDYWPLMPNAKGKRMADGPRYKILGNSFAVPVIRRMGTRIDAATQPALEKAA